MNSEDENLIEWECEGKWDGGESGGFDGGVNKAKEDTWGDEDWENESCEVGLQTIDLDWEDTVWTLAGVGRVSDVDKGTVGKGASICGGERLQKVFWWFQGG